MRKMTLAALTAAAGLVFGATQANATHFAGTWNIANYANLDPALVVQLTATSGSFDFTLSESDQIETIHLFNIYTNEGSLESDDFAQTPIVLEFNFDDPDDGNVGPVGGVTGGYYLIFAGGGFLDWSPGDGGPPFGGGTDFTWGPLGDGLLSIDVNGGTFNPAKCFIVCGTSLQKGPTKALTVEATFDWDRDATAVPEPATWALMIGGFGLAGGALRRRRAIAA